MTGLTKFRFSVAAFCVLAGITWLIEWNLKSVGASLVVGVCALVGIRLEKSRP
jgi:hypothetical protein